VAVKTDGTLWAWGQGIYGQLGLNNLTNYSSPKQIGVLTTWSKISNCSGSGFAIKTDGTLWSWGINTAGQLGLGNTTNRSSPNQVGASTTWLKIACGYVYAIAELY
jgi:alpha-tubulin suppressor-like RCC1 family protein